MPNPHAFANLEAATPAALAGLRVGIDVTDVRAIAASLEAFGARFLARIFREDEVSYAVAAPAHTAHRLAARFAAKEAAMKAFGWSEAGVGWRDIEVRRGADGACSLGLHGRAAELAQATGCSEVALSLSHDGDYAAAVVAARRPSQPERALRREAGPGRWS